MKKCLVLSYKTISFSVFGALMLLSNLLQDHNIDFIVKFPDWNPQQNPKANNSKENWMKIISTLGGRRVLLGETSSELPKSHLWYSTAEVINSLKLFIDAGNDLAGSLTYR